MTWKQFKEEVDKQLAEKNISEDEEIWYIDIGAFPDTVSVDSDKTGLAIT